MNYTLHDFQDGQVLYGWQMVEIDEAVKYLVDNVDEMLPEVAALRTVETGTKTLTNTQEFPFNNSAVTVALQKAQSNNLYTVDVEVTAYSGGNVGDIVVSNRATNGFTLSFTGSATSVTVAYIVKGGFAE